MTSAQVVETSVTKNSPSQDSNHPDDHLFSFNQRIFISYMSTYLVFFCFVVVFFFSFILSVVCLFKPVKAYLLNVAEIARGTSIKVVI